METREHFDFHVFLSHNSKQKQYVRDLVDALRGLRLTVFFDDDCILPGDDVVRAIEQGLIKSRHIVLVLSEAALASRWVALEWAASVHRDPDAARRSILPVLRENCDVPLSLARLKFIDARDEDLGRHVKELLTAIDKSSAPLSESPLQRPPAEGRIDSFARRPKIGAPGGAMHFDSPLYIVRRSDQELQTLLQEGADVLMIYGPRQIGKTSMMYRALHREALNGVDVVQIDCSALGARTLSEFLGQIVLRLKAGTRHEGAPFDIAPVSNDRLRSVDEFTKSCSELTSPAILALDELDFIRCLPDAGGFMYILRGIFEQKRFRADSNLKLLLSSFLSPFDLVADTTQISPFNIGQAFVIKPFDREQVESLFRRLGLDLSRDEVDLVYRFTGGQPYLSHQLAYVAARESADVEDIIDDESKYQERFTLHLRTLENHIRSDSMTRDAFAKFEEGTLKPPVFMGDIGRLVDLGVITYEHGTLTFSNQLYRVVFGGNKRGAT